MTPATILFKAAPPPEPDAWEGVADVPAGRYKIIVKWGVDGPAECLLVPVAPTPRVLPASRPIAPGTS